MRDQRFYLRTKQAQHGTARLACGRDELLDVGMSNMHDVIYCSQLQA